MLSFATLLRRFRRGRPAGGLERRNRRRRKTSRDDGPVRARWLERLLPLMMILLVWAVAALGVTFRPRRAQHALVRGQRNPANIYAEVDFHYTDLAATELAQRVALRAVADVYRIDSAANELSASNFRQFLGFLQGSRVSGDEMPAEGLIAMWESLPEDHLDMVRILFDNSDKRSFLLHALGRLLSRGVIGSDSAGDSRPIWIIDELGRRNRAQYSTLQTPKSVAQGVLARLLERFPQRFGTEATRSEIADTVFAPLVYPNLAYDAELTAKEQEKVVASVPEVALPVRAGTLFLPKGAVVTREDLRKLEAHAEALRLEEDSALNSMRQLSLLLLTLLVTGIGGFYLAEEFGSAVLKPRDVVLVALAVVFGLLANRGAEELVFSVLDVSRLFFYPAMPLALVATVLTLLVGVRVGIAAGLFVALLAAVQAEESLHLFVLGTTASCLGAAAVYGARTRTQTFRGALAVTVAVFAVESVYMVRTVTPWQTYAEVLGVAAANGFGTLVLANLFLPAAEYMFRVTTNFNLLELSDLNHPLLKRLQMEAPGTYHHTLMVATLAEHAAEAIGANPLLARVAAYFHDIGKLANPSYFTENSFGQDRHEDLKPRMSALIIINHMKEGLALARKYKLHEPLCEVIESHHGDSVVYYFYRAAVEQANGDAEAVNEQDFRYPGRKPRSREATIISLADSCEAASRSLEKPSPQKIDVQVSDIFRGKLLSGQLSESMMTMTEISKVEASIKKTLHTMLHGRVAYPKPLEDADTVQQENPKVAVAASSDDAAGAESGGRADRPAATVAG